jgi:hypothetical protein
MKNLEIIEDWEREFLKDFVYLHEEGQDLSDKINQELNRQPAQIVVIDTNHILDKKKTHETKHYGLPF